MALDPHTVDVLTRSVDAILSEAQEMYDIGRYDRADALLREANSLLAWNEPFDEARQAFFANPAELHWH